MISFVKVLLIITMIALLGTLVMGSRAFMNKEADRSVSNKWMQRRIFVQIIAVFLIAIFFFLRRTTG